MPASGTTWPRPQDWRATSSPSHRARAEYFQLHGNLQNALQHLNYALQLVENNYPLTARLNQRVQDIREMRQRTAS
ncbi:MAG: hypothetical protein U5R48_02085 [Gammaproteobacteria bacterium]|nr:hypothetical protein [Gammaproteobacteria bacterium]